MMEVNRVLKTKSVIQTWQWCAACSQTARRRNGAARVQFFSATSLRFRCVKTWRARQQSQEG